MTRTAIFLMQTGMAMGILLVPCMARAAQPPAVLSSSGWQTPKPDEVKAQVLAWMNAGKLDAAVAEKIQKLWGEPFRHPNDDELLARLATTFAMVDSRAAKLVDMCSKPHGNTAPPVEEWLREPSVPSLFANNLRLFYAHWLVRESLFDEALGQLTGLMPNDVVAPASLLFYQGVVHHALLNKDSGIKSLEELIQGQDSSPKRYIAVAKLMEEDLQGLDEESLDHISRRMNDIRRRLDLGRAGPKVRQIQDGVIDSLDKMIKDIESQQQQQQQSQEMAENIQSSNPAQDSYLRGGKGPGEVTKKNIGTGSGWGELPPKEREEAMQQIGRDFPSHYRDVIEQYFRRLATEENP